jgi:hypothetical protein
MQGHAPHSLHMPTLLPPGPGPCCKSPWPHLDSHTFPLYVTLPHSSSLFPLLQGWAEPARFYDPILNIKMQFTSVADYAPFSVRKSALIDVGGIDEGLSEPGECGIFSDADLCMRLWASGYYVAHMYVPYGSDGEEGSSHGSLTGARWVGRVGLAPGQPGSWRRRAAAGAGQRTSCALRT